MYGTGFYQYPQRTSTTLLDIIRLESSAKRSELVHHQMGYQAPQ